MRTWLASMVLVLSMLGPRPERPESVPARVGAPIANQAGRGIANVPVPRPDLTPIGRYSRFTEVAYVASPACSEDYSRIDQCYNEINPPAPSITRPLSKEPDYSTKVAVFPSASGVAGKPYILPFARSSNDGRLLLHGGNYPTYYPQWLALRPMRADYNQTLKSTSLPWGPRVNMHPLVYFNPGRTGFQLGNSVPYAFHNLPCDDSGQAFQTGGDFQLSEFRNPTACRARKNPNDPLKSGDCYQITFLTNMDNTPFVQAGMNTHTYWELRSIDLTIFVADAKTTNAGSSIWVYPRRTLSPDGSTILPNYADYDLFSLIPSGQEVQKARELCSFMGRTPLVDFVRKRPAWCEFQDRQEWSSQGFEFDHNDNAVLGDYSHWDGTHCSGTNDSASCYTHYLFEPTVTGDGRLMVVNSVSGLYYSINEKGSCRADGFQKFKPFSFMPIDPDATSKYAIAQSTHGLPFRDSAGEEVPFGQPFQGAYQWLDRDGKNMIYSQVNLRRDNYKAVSATPSQPDPEYQGDRDSTVNPDQKAGKGSAVIGAWTHGKVVMLDQGPTRTDWGGSPSGAVFNLKLYQGAMTAVKPTGVTMHGSFENRLNHYDALSPRFPMDVVWTVSGNNQANSEIPFDEYLMPSTFVNASMNAAVRADGTPLDGFTPTSSTMYGMPTDWSFTSNPLIQNAATVGCASTTAGVCPSLTPPKTLRLRGGARIEPIGWGGVVGKGVYLDGQNDFIDMGYPAKPSERDWFFAIWLDSRELNPSQVRTLYYFADGSWIGLSQEKIIAHAPNGQEQSVSIAGMVSAQQYFHLGITIEDEEGQRVLRFILNGTELSGEERFLKFGLSSFDLMGGAVNGWTWFTVGDPGPSFGAPGRKTFKGWIDEFRIHSLDHQLFPEGEWEDEFYCNLAHGTMVDVGDQGYSTPNSAAFEALRARAQLYGILPKNLRTPAPAPGVSQRVLVCEQRVIASTTAPMDSAPGDRNSMCIERVHGNPHPDESAAMRCLRGTMLELMPLSAALPRPDFSKNNFCLSCHRPDAPLEALRTGALDPKPSLARYRDRRRQPLNWPATVHGQIPAGLASPPPGPPSLTGERGLTRPWEPETGAIYMDFSFDGGAKLSP